MHVINKLQPTDLNPGLLWGPCYFWIQHRYLGSHQVPEHLHRTTLALLQDSDPSGGYSWSKQTCFRKLPRWAGNQRKQQHPSTGPLPPKGILALTLSIPGSQGSEHQRQGQQGPRCLLASRTAQQGWCPPRHHHVQAPPPSSLRNMLMATLLLGGCTETRNPELGTLTHECAAGSLRPCNPGRNYSVTVWIWLCQNSSDSQQANLQRPTQPSHRWLVLKNLYQHYCRDWNNPVYMRPSIFHSSFCKTNKNNTMKTTWAFTAI